MVRQNYDPISFYPHLIKYSKTTKEEEMIYGAAVRKVVDSNPGIIAATNIILLDEIVPERFKKLLKLEGIDKLEEMKDVARGYLEPFNNPWKRNGEVENWLEKRDEKTWKSFSKLEKYDASRRALVTANLRLAIERARNFNNYWLSVDDSIQVANIGLEKAAIRYDPQRGVRFGTYAHNWIYQMLIGQLPEESYILPVPSQLFKDILKIKKIQQRLFEERGITPRLEDLIDAAKNQGISSRAVKASLKIRSTTKIHIGSFEDGGVDPEDTSLESPLDEVIKIYDKKAVHAMIDCLNEREKKVIMSRFGIHNGNGASKEQETRTLKEIGEHFGVTPERIRQIQNNALEKMKRLHSRFYR